MGAAWQLVEDFRRRGQRHRATHVGLSGFAEGQRDDEVEGVQFVDREVLSGLRCGFDDDLPLRFRGYPARFDVSAVAAEVVQQFADGVVELATGVVA